MRDYIWCGFSTSSHRVHVSVNGVVPYISPAATKYMYLSMMVVTYISPVEVFMTGVIGQHVPPSNYPPRLTVLGPDVPPDSRS